MNDSTGPKQKIVEKIKDSSNILVTVSKNPNVDELAAALGLTLMLDEMQKHPTAVVSGAIPPAISFLDPEQTFESTVDSLRDFIIAIDKEKADHLRYKVEGDVVKIFITPYRTTLSDADLDFSQGDYNVELVLALGVDTQDNLDAALSSHGKIFHDATVVGLSVGEEKSSLGSINWHEANASSISEMLVSLSEALKSDKKLLTEQVATAFLTGIVASTDRFSNDKTSSKVMTMAAQLMAAGANQQLIASKLQENDAISRDASMEQVDDEPTDTMDSEEPEEAPEPAAVGALSISHEKRGDLDEVARQTEAQKQAEAAAEAEQSLAERLQAQVPAPQPSIQEQIVAEADSTDIANEPAMGGTLNATAEEAAEVKRREEANDRNRTILTHGPAGGGHAYVGNAAPQYSAAPLNATMQENTDEPKRVDIFDGAASPVSTPADAPGIAPTITPLSTLPPQQSSVSTVPPAAPPSQLPPFETLADIDRKNRADMHSDAQAAVQAAFASPDAGLSSLPPAPQPASTLPPLPDFSNMPKPELPPLPQFGQQPSGAMHPEHLEQLFNTPQPQSPQQPPQPADPNQFKIPGQ